MRKAMDFKYVLNYDVEETGFLTAIPSLAHIPLKLVSGVASDNIR